MEEVQQLIINYELLDSSSNYSEKKEVVPLRRLVAIEKERIFRVLGFTTIEALEMLGDSTGTVQRSLRKTLKLLSILLPPSVV